MALVADQTLVKRHALRVEIRACRVDQSLHPPLTRDRAHEQPCHERVERQQLGQHGKKPASHALEGAKCCIEADHHGGFSLRRVQALRQAQGNGGTGGMADDRIGLPTLRGAKADDILGHHLKPATLARPQRRETLTRQIKRHNVEILRQIGQDIAPAMGGPACAVDQQDQRAGA